MGYMKKLFALIACMFVFAGVASAHEGSIDLTSSSVSCKGISLFQDGNYKLVDAVMVWFILIRQLMISMFFGGKTSDRGDIVRVAEVDRGYFSGMIPNAFDSMFITAEKDSLARKPSDWLWYLAR